MRKTLAEIRAEQLKAKLVQANPFIANDNCKCYDAEYECKCVCNENTEE